ncbi:MAG: hypothetical protein LRY69_05485, partial [Gammaproteobacteria bacterium]|nr:hypothetical protein [Gammaproteobacteria bacterium]
DRNIGCGINKNFIFKRPIFCDNVNQTLVFIGAWPVTINNLVLIVGGLFLIINPAREITALRTFKEEKKIKHYANFSSVIIQIMFIDIVFSIDNVVTAIGIAKLYSAMIAAILLAMIAMVAASNTLSRIIDKYPTFKIIGLCYLIWIGGVLVIRGLGYDVSGGYIYLPLAFVIFTQMILGYARA